MLRGQLDLIGGFHVFVEDRLRDRHQAGVSNPCSVVARAHFTQLVLTDTLHRFFVRLWVVADGNLGRHASHGMNAALVACVNQHVHVGTKERLFHGDGAALGKRVIQLIPEHLDETENVIPATAVQTGGVLAQFVENLVHLKSSRDGFDQYSGANCSLGNTDIFLSKEEDIVPQARLTVALQFGQVEIGSGIAIEEGAKIVEEVQPKIKERRRDRTAVDGKMEIGEAS